MQLFSGLFSLCLKFIAATQLNQMVPYVAGSDHASSKHAEASFRAGVSRAHWDYFCWTVRFDASPGEHGQSTGLAECEMVHINLRFGAPGLAGHSGALASAPILTEIRHGTVECNDF